MTASEVFMYWSGVGAWFVLALIGFFWVLDRILEWLVDSVRFKAWVVAYLSDRMIGRE